MGITIGTQLCVFHQIGNEALVVSERWPDYCLVIIFAFLRLLLEYTMFFKDNHL